MLVAPNKLEFIEMNATCPGVGDGIAAPKDWRAKSAVWNVENDRVGPTLKSHNR